MNGLFASPIFWSIWKCTMFVTFIIEVTKYLTRGSLRKWLILAHSSRDPVHHGRIGIVTGAKGQLVTLPLQSRSRECWVTILSPLPFYTSWVPSLGNDGTHSIPSSHLNLIKVLFHSTARCPPLRWQLRLTFTEEQPRALPKRSLWTLPWLLIAVGGPRPLWAAPSLGRCPWVV